MTDLKLTDTQRQQLQDFTADLALRMGRELTTYIETDILPFTPVAAPASDQSVASADDIAVLPVAVDPVSPTDPAIVPVPDDIATDTSLINPNPALDPTALSFDPPPPQDFIASTPTASPAFDVPNAPLPTEPISAPAGLPTNDFTIPASEIAPPAEHTALAFGTPAAPPQLDDLDGSDLNYTPPADLPPVGDSAILPPQPIAVTEVAAELDLPAPSGIEPLAPALDPLPQPITDSDTSVSPLADPQSSTPPTPADSSQSKGHDLLSKVMSKGWGKKSQ
jgi:hypothetical protein